MDKTQKISEELDALNKEYWFTYSELSSRKIDCERSHIFSSILFFIIAAALIFIIIFNETVLMAIAVSSILSSVVAGVVGLLVIKRHKTISTKMLDLNRQIIEKEKEARLEIQNIVSEGFSDFMLTEENKDPDKGTILH